MYSTFVCMSIWQLHTYVNYLNILTAPFVNLTYVLPSDSCPDPLFVGDDVSGSGSGMCTDDICSRSQRPVVPITERPNLYPPEQEKVMKASANQNLPFITIYLLSLLVLLLRR